MGEAELEMGQAKAEAELEMGEAKEDPYSSCFGSFLICNLQYGSRDSCINFLKALPSEKTSYKNILHYMLAEDYPNCIRAVIESLSSYDPATPPLHQVARCGAHSLAQLFLDYGQDPNVRANYTSQGSHLKEALPLEVALHNCRETIFFKWHGCVFRLLCKLCASKRCSLELARVLALQTKELDQEIFKYVKEGKVEYLCTLMLLGYHTRIPSVECFEGDESKKKQMLQLVEIFQRIGDKLQVYVRLPRASCKISRLGRVAMDIASMFRDAGLPVKSIDTMMSTCPDRYVKEKEKEKYGTVGDDSRSLREANIAPLSYNLHGVQELNGSHMAYNVTWGSRSLHTKVSKAVLAHSSPLKGSVYVLSNSSPFWKKSSFWMMALRRAIRHI